MTASAPSNVADRSSRSTSAHTQRVFGTRQAVGRRAIPTISSTAGSAASACTTLVPTLPVAPVTTMRMPSTLPDRALT